MKRFISAIAILLFSFNLYGQEEDINLRKNAFYTELLGNGVVYSLNYERLFETKDLNSFVRLGSNALHFDSLNTFKIYFVSEMGIIIGKHRNFIDASLGYTFPLSEDVKDRFFVIRTGFRYSGPKGFLLRLSPMYIINTQKGDVFGNNFWAGLSLGYTF